MDYRLERRDRKSISVQIKGGEVLVKAPLSMKKSDIDRFVETHRNWIEERLERAQEVKREIDSAPPLTYAEIEKLADKALEIIPPRVEHYAELLGVKYGNITVRNQRTRWGSCSSKGNLSFNCLLMLAPIEVLDSVIVHELCHLKEMNHSKRFYSEVLRVFPDYYKHHEWLKQNGELLVGRMIGFD